MKKIKAVIFDMDGLIVDTETIESKSLIKLLTEYGKTPVLNDTGLVHVVGVNTNVYEKLIEEYSIEEKVEVFRDRKREIFSELLKEKLIPFDGFFDLIKLLKKHKIRIALASNRFIKHMHLILENLEVKEFFEVIAGPDEERRHKPHPDIYLHAAKELKIDPKDCAALEDSESGVVSANAAGMKVIAIPNQYTKSQDLSKADIIAKSLSDVTIELLESL